MSTDCQYRPPHGCWPLPASTAPGSANVSCASSKTSTCSRMVDHFLFITECVLSVLIPVLVFQFLFLGSNPDASVYSLCLPVHFVCVCDDCVCVCVWWWWWCVWWWCVCVVVWVCVHAHTCVCVCVCSFFQEGLKTLTHFQDFVAGLVSQVDKIKQRQEHERKQLIELRDALKGSMTSYKEVSAKASPPHPSSQFKFKKLNLPMRSILGLMELG